MELNYNISKSTFTFRMCLTIYAILTVFSKGHAQGNNPDLPPLIAQIGTHIDGDVVFNGSAVVGYGSDKALRFWNGSDLFKISMGNSSEFTYGPVTSYSIKTGMSGHAGRGWTWGISASPPIAALDNQGRFQTAKGITAGNALIDTWTTNSAFAFFGHKDHNTELSYALLQKEDGETRLNAPAGKKVSLRNGDIEQASIESNGLWVKTSLNIAEDSSIRFWGGSNLYKMQMGDAIDYQYGPVTNFSIKSTTGAETGNGWTWGISGLLPSAALSNLGELQLRSSLVAGNAFMGSTGYGETSPAYFGHTTGSVKSGNESGYAIKQESTGATAINSKEEIRFNINNDMKMLLKNNGDFIVHKRMAIGEDNIIEGTALTVDGRVYISDNDTAAERGFLGNFSTNENYKDYLLWVEEGIVSFDFAISEITDWPDYVFNEDYKLLSLAEVEKFIKETGHLHTMPSAKTAEKEGFTVKQMTKNLVQTVEELTLHTIQKEKKIIEQDEKIKLLKERIENLEKIAAKKGN